MACGLDVLALDRLEYRSCSSQPVTPRVSTSIEKIISVWWRSGATADSRYSFFEACSISL
jgi:hypothetical protein